MSILNSPSIVREGLIFHYDMNSPSSYVGPPLTNILPNGIYAGYPTSSSGWATYNTNQYGSGTYFSIGTITGVSSNIITCPGHPLRTYDVMQPQSTGGGVTGGTNYLVRKWDSNSFSLYAYDGTQDSTNIFQTQVNLNTDNRIAVSSGITNMWWGYPHLPNSGIMKQTITNGFQYKGRVHDCMRFHFYRADGVQDAMAYGNEPSITAGQTYTISFYHRAATPNCVGYSGGIYRYTNGEYTGTTFTLNKNWTKLSYTFTTGQSGTTYFYWFNSNVPAQSAYDISEVMIYQGSGSSEYVSSGVTRSTSQSVFDLTGLNTITATNLTYASDGTFSWSSGTDARLQSPSSSNFSFGTGDFTLECWINPTNFNSYTHMIALPDQNTFALKANASDGAIYFYSPSFSTYPTSGWTLTAGAWNHVVMTRSNGTAYCYLNGVLKGSKSGFSNSFSSQILNIGNGYTNEYTAKSIASVKIYNNALTDLQVQQNFNAQRGRYGL